jgi:hypothetical protein
MKVKRSFCAALFVYAAHSCMAQAATPEVITTAGGYSSCPTGSINWTMGEPLVETGITAESILSQGFQQPSKLVVTSVENNNAQGGISAYPNPTVSTVSITSAIAQDLKVDVMDADGKKLLTKSFSANEDKVVNMSSYAFGIYFFRVYTTEGKLLQTLKIEKVK